MGKQFSNTAVTEVLSTIFLLMIAVGVFASGSIIMVSSIDQTTGPVAPIVTIVGFMQGNVAVLEHRGGDSLLLNTTELKLSISNQYGDASFLKTAALDHHYWVGNSTYGDTIWSIGQQMRYDFENFLHPTDRLEAELVDTISNTVLFSGVLQTGFKDKTPLVITLDATDVSTDSATIHMSYDFYEFFGGSIAFRYRQENLEWVYTNWIFVNTGNNMYSYPLKNLEQNGVVYEFEAFISYTDSSGQTIHIYGDTKTFTTLAELVGYWNFDSMDHNIAEDSSSYQHDGSIVGTVDLVQGVVEDAYHFPGFSPNHVEIEHADHLTVTQGLSIASWIKPDSDPDTGYKGQLKNAKESDIIINSEPFNKLSDCYEASIVHVKDSVYAIAYRNFNNRACLMTVSIGDDSVVSVIQESTLEIEFRVKHPDIVKVNDERLFAIAWAHHSSDRIIISTILIDDEGTIDLDSLITHTIHGLGYYNIGKPVLVDSTYDYDGEGYIFLLASGGLGQGTTDDSSAGSVLSIYIFNNGESKEFNRVYLHARQCTKVDAIALDEPGMFAIVYAYRHKVIGEDGFGYYYIDNARVDTFFITEEGEFKKLDKYSFSIPYLAEPSITRKGQTNTFVIAFGGYSYGYGFAYGLTINPNDGVIPLLQSKLIVYLSTPGDSMLQPTINYVGESVYVVTYGTIGSFHEHGTNIRGYGVKTFSYATGPSNTYVLDSVSGWGNVTISDIISIDENRFMVLYSDSLNAQGDGLFVFFDVLDSDPLKNIISKGSCYQILATDSQLFVYLDTTPIFSTPIPTNQWSFMVLTYEKNNLADNVRLYINAVEVATATFELGQIDGEPPVRIGGFKGAIDEVRLYASSVNTDIITNLYTI